jgi:hypothetical protein
MKVHSRLVRLLFVSLSFTFCLTAAGSDSVPHCGGQGPTFWSVPFMINAPNADDDGMPRVSLRGDGAFVVAWGRHVSDAIPSQSSLLFCRFFDNRAVPTTDDVLIDCENFVEKAQNAPSILIAVQARAHICAVLS